MLAGIQPPSLTPHHPITRQSPSYHFAQSPYHPTPYHPTTVYTVRQQPLALIVYPPETR